MTKHRLGIGAALGRTSVAAAGVLLVVGGLSLAATTATAAAAAAAPPASASGTCYSEGTFGSVMLAGSSWLGGHGVTVYSNGSTCTVTNVYNRVSGVTSGMEWQCVELVNRLYLTEGWIKATWSGNGNQMYSTAPANLSKQPQGSIAYLDAGDVVSYSGGSAGHVGIVNAVTPNGHGGFTVQLVNQNTPDTITSTTLSGGSLTAPWSGFAVIGVIHAPAQATTVHTSAALIPGDGAAGYVLDGYGGLHAFGGAPTVTSPTNWGGWDIARALAVVGPGSGYILDGYGGLHTFGAAAALADGTYWSGWDIARGLALCPRGGAGYVLDGFGGVHPVGDAPTLAVSAYWSGWDIARGIVVNSTCTGGYVLDGYGGIHPFGAAPAVNGTAYWSGWDIARSIVLVTDTSGYVLDGYGGIHPFAATGTVMPAGLPDPGYDSAATDPFAALAIDAAGAGVAVARSYSTGLIHVFAV